MLEGPSSFRSATDLQIIRLQKVIQTCESEWPRQLLEEEPHSLWSLSHQLYRYLKERSDGVSTTEKEAAAEVFKVSLELHGFSHPIEHIFCPLLKHQQSTDDHRVRYFSHLSYNHYIHGVCITVAAELIYLHWLFWWGMVICSWDPAMLTLGQVFKASYVWVTFGST